MFCYKIDKGSIPSEDIVRNNDYYVIDAETVESIAYIIEVQDLDEDFKTCEDFVYKVMENIL